MSSNKLFRTVCLLLLTAALPSVVLAASRTAVHTVVINGMLFVPAELSVNVGDTVVWKNNDPFPHTATSARKRFDSKGIAPGHSWKFIATRRGDFPYLCTLHRTMLGKLSVK